MPSAVAVSNGMPNATPREAPLAGIRILELGHYVAAPFATRLLGDLGAEIIKVEPPNGNPVRQWGARYKGSAPGGACTPATRSASRST